MTMGLSAAQRVTKLLPLFADITNGVALWYPHASPLARREYWDTDKTISKYLRHYLEFFHYAPLHGGEALPERSGFGKKSLADE